MNLTLCRLSNTVLLNEPNHVIPLEDTPSPVLVSCCCEFHRCWRPSGVWKMVRLVFDEKCSSWCGKGCTVIKLDGNFTPDDTRGPFAWTGLTPGSDIELSAFIAANIYLMAALFALVNALLRQALLWQSADSFRARRTEEERIRGDRVSFQGTSLLWFPRLLFTAYLARGFWLFFHSIGDPSTGASSDWSRDCQLPKGMENNSHPNLLPNPHCGHIWMTTLNRLSMLLLVSALSVVAVYWWSLLQRLQSAIEAGKIHSSLGANLSFLSEEQRDVLLRGGKNVNKCKPDLVLMLFNMLLYTSEIVAIALEGVDNKLTIEGAAKVRVANYAVLSVFFWAIGNFVGGPRIANHHAALAVPG